MSIALNSRIKDLEQKVLSLKERVNALEAAGKSAVFTKGTVTLESPAAPAPKRRGRPPKAKPVEATLEFEANTNE